MSIKITLNGQGGELDCRVIDPTEDTLEAEVRDAVMDIALNCVLAVGDTITIEEVANG